MEAPTEKAYKGLITRLMSTSRSLGTGHSLSGLTPKPIKNHLSDQKFYEVLAAAMATTDWNVTDEEPF